MSNERKIIRKTEKMIDELKSVCSTYGLGNASSEYKIITEIFLYKYMNDKFLYEVKQIEKNKLKDANTKEVELYLENLTPEQYSLLIMKMNPNVARLKKEYMISYLFNNQNSTYPEFYELFDSALVGISNDNIEIFSVKTGSKERIKLFDPLSQYITESDKKNAFFRAMISKLVEFSFEDSFKEKYDFFATIFEYLIKDYNKDFGKYAEYYTPNSIARIIARILAPKPTRNVTLYDPSAGSGTLVLALAHQIGEENCTIYTQDISQKSNEFLRLNLILNNLVHSLGNVIHGDTLLTPAHLNNEKNGLAKFDYIVSNPPFKTDFSDTREQLADDKYKDRFFAGVPNILKKNKDKMSIYLLFIQHILYSLKDNGKAAIVVPTGFITAKKGIELVLRKKLIDENLVESVISMPSNIFANTGTNVSIIFINKSKNNKNILLADVSSMGESVRNGKTKKTILKNCEIEEIINIMVEKKCVEGKSILVSKERIKDFNYDFSASLYFPIKYYKKLNDLENIKHDIFKNNDALQETFAIQNSGVLNYFDIISKMNFLDKDLNSDLTCLEIPDNWEVKKLGDIFTFEKGKIPDEIYDNASDGTEPYLIIETLNGIENQFVSNKTGNLVRNEVVMVMDGAASGTVFQGKKGVLGSTLAKLQIKKDVKINNEYLFYILKNLEKEISVRNTGSTVPHANKLFIENICIAIPKDEKLLNEFNNYFTQVRKMIISLENQIKDINNNNNLLYSAISNGQIYF